MGAILSSIKGLPYITDSAFMDIQSLEERVKKIEEKLREREEIKTGRYSALKQRRQKRELLRGWQRSFLRKAVPLAISYVAIGLFLQILQTPEPWLHALTPVLTITVFTAVTPLVRRYWFKWEGNKLEAERRDGL